MYLTYGIGDRNERLKELAIIKTRSIDTLKVFKQKIIESALKYDNIDYPSHKLDDISKACIGEGKLEDLTGPEVINLSIDKQLDYCGKDAELVLKILQRDNWIVFQMIDAMTLPVNMKFIDICNAEYPTRIGKNILQLNDYSNDMVPFEYRTIKIDYVGGEVMQPTAGVYQNVVGVDCKSQYPNIIKKLNLSSETINCPCCVSDQSSRIPDHIMKELNEGLIAKGEKPQEHFWICKQKEGIFARIERQLFELKSHYEALGETVKAKTMKLLANSLYGMFQNLRYRYVDQRLGLIITAAGRVIVKGLSQKCLQYNTKAIYGDTDSTFLQLYDNSELDKFIKDSEKEYGAPLAVDKEWQILILTENKKGYFGITKQGKFVYKKLPGMKSNSTALQMRLMSYIVRRETLESFVKDKSETQNAVLEDIRHIFKELEDRINSNDIDYIRSKLAFAFTAEKRLDQYEGNGYENEIYLERLADGKGIEADNRYYYYKINPVEDIDSATGTNTGKARLKKFTTHPEKYQLNIWKYKEGLFNCIEKILFSLEFDIVSLRNELVGTEPGRGKSLKRKSSDNDNNQ